jgi:hypothetical protein
MNFVWTWWGLPGTFGFVAAWCCAIIVFRTAPKRQLNRRLGLILLLEGAFSGGLLGFIFFIENPAVVNAVVAVGTAALAALPFQYLAFLSIALDTPLVVPFRTRPAKFILNAASIAVAIIVLAKPDQFFSDLYSPGWATWNFQFVHYGQWATQLQGIVYLFGLIAALSAFFMTEKESTARNRAMWFAIAFGCRDIYTGSVQLLYPFARSVPFWGDFIYNPGQGIVFSIYILLLAYGVLRTQLFDIDLKIKFVLRQSTVAAMIAGLFIVASEVLESMISVSGLTLSVLVAVGILIILRPMHRFALRVTDRLMSGVQDTPEYLDARKNSVYRAAIEGAVEDGIVTDKERRILDRLREELGISPDDAAQIENELQHR